MTKHFKNKIVDIVKQIQKTKGNEQQHDERRPRLYNAIERDRSIVTIVNADEQSMPKLVYNKLIPEDRAMYGPTYNQSIRRKVKSDIDYLKENEYYKQIFSENTIARPCCCYCT